MPHGAIPYPFGDCRICNDKATGVHYGVATCEGCKGFFKRSTTKGDKYKCFFGGQCVLSPQNRNRCKACRYQRCLQTGMSIEAVKMGRIPKVDKEKALETHRNAQTEKLKEMDQVGAHASIPGGVGPSMECPIEHQDPNKPLFVPQVAAIAANNVIEVAPQNIASNAQTRNSQSNSPKTLGEHFMTSKPSSDSGVSSERSPENGILKLNHPGTSSGDNNADWQRNGFTQDEKYTKQSNTDRNKQNNTTESSSRSRSGSSTPKPTFSCYSGGVIKELLSQVIENAPIGNAQQTLLKQLVNVLDPYDKNSQQSQKEVSEILCNLTSHMQSNSGASGHLKNWRENSAMRETPSHNYETVPSSQKRPPEGHVPNEPPFKRSGHESLGPDFDSLERFLADSVMHNPNVNFPGKAPNSSGVATKNNTLEHDQHYNHFYRHNDSESSIAGPSNYTSHPASHNIEVNDGKNMGQKLQPNMFDPFEFDRYLEPKSRQQSHGGNCVKNEFFEDNGRLERNAEHRHQLGPQEERFHTGMNTRVAIAEDLSLPLSLPDTPEILTPPDKSSSDERAMIETTAKKIEELRDAYFVDVRESKIFMEDEVAGRRENHALNSLVKSSRAQVQFIWDQLISSIPQHNARVIGLCKSLPGFTSLDPKDQAILMEEAYFDIWLVSNSCMFYKGESYLRLSCKARYSQWWMRHFLPKPLVEEMFQFAESVNRCNLTEAEIIAVCAIQVTDPDRKGLINREQIRVLHNHYLDVFAHQVQETHKAASGRVLINIFRVLPMLGPLNQKQGEVIGNFKIDQPPDGCLKFCADQECAI